MSKITVELDWEIKSFERVISWYTVPGSVEFDELDK